MLKKIFITAIASLLLFVSFGTSGNVGSESLGNTPMVCVYPCEIRNVNVGETVILSIVVDTYVENLYGFDIVFMWDPAVIEYVSHTVMAPVESYSDGVLHSPVFSLKDEVDLAGVYWVAYSSMSPAEPFSGDGVLFTVTFEVLSATDKQPFELVSVMLSDDKGQPMHYSDIEESPPETSDERQEQMRKQADRHNIGFKQWWLTVMRRHYPCPHPFHHPN
jgi:hypothetical protein